MAKKKEYPNPVLNAMPAQRYDPFEGLDLSQIKKYLSDPPQESSPQTLDTHFDSPFLSNIKHLQDVPAKKQKISNRYEKEAVPGTSSKTDILSEIGNLPIVRDIPVHPETKEKCNEFLRLPESKDVLGTPFLPEISLDTDLLRKKKDIPVQTKSKHKRNKIKHLDKPKDVPGTPSEPSFLSEINNLPLTEDIPAHSGIEEICNEIITLNKEKAVPGTSSFQKKQSESNNLSAEQNVRVHPNDTAFLNKNKHLAKDKLYPEKRKKDSFSNKFRHLHIIQKVRKKIGTPLNLNKRNKFDSLLKKQGVPRDIPLDETAEISLTDKQTQVLSFLSSKREKFTRIREISEITGNTFGYTRKILRALEKKNMLKKHPQTRKNGKQGFEYEISISGFQKKFDNLALTVPKAENSSHKDIYNNKEEDYYLNNLPQKAAGDVPIKLSFSEEPDSLLSNEEIALAFPLLWDKGLRSSHIAHISKQWQKMHLDSAELVFSLERAEWDIAHNPTKFSTPLRYVLSALLRGPYSIPSSFKSKAILAAEYRLEEARKLKEMLDEEISIRFELWWYKELNSSEREKIDSELTLKTGAKGALLNEARIQFYKSSVFSKR